MTMKQVKIQQKNLQNVSLNFIFSLKKNFISFQSIIIDSRGSANSSDSSDIEDPDNDPTIVSTLFDVI